MVAASPSVVSPLLPSFHTHTHTQLKELTGYVRDTSPDVFIFTISSLEVAMATAGQISKFKVYFSPTIVENGRALW